jgi:methyl-accepting chemotaxis protein
VFSLTAAVVYLLILIVVCQMIVARHLRPLGLLADSAQRIAEGRLDETVPDSGRNDEIGQLQNSFVKMQRSLSDYISDMQQKRETLSQQNEKLQIAYEQAQEAGSVKEHFLSNMTDQMSVNIGSITTLTETLCNDYKTLSRAEMAKIQIQIVNETETITMLLDKMLSAT